MSAWHAGVCHMSNKQCICISKMQDLKQNPNYLEVGLYNAILKNLCLIEL